MGKEAATETKQYGRWDVIFRCGDEAGCMYEVLGGCVGIYSDYGTPQEKLLTRVETGGFFGEMAMIEAAPRSATAVAMSVNTEVWIITWKTFGAFFRDRPSAIVVIMQSMGRRIRELTQDYLGACRAITELAEKTEREKQEAQAAWINNNMRRYLDAYRSMAIYETHPRE